MRRALDMPTGLFHGGIIKADFNDGLCGHECGATADDSCPERITALVQGPAYKGIIAREMFDLGRAAAPEIGGNGLSASGNGPPIGQVGEILPGGSTEHPMPEGHHKGSKRRGHEGGHGGILHIKETWS